MRNIFVVMQKHTKDPEAEWEISEGFEWAYCHVDKQKLIEYFHKWEDFEEYDLEYKIVEFTPFKIEDVPGVPTKEPKEKLEIRLERAFPILCENVRSGVWIGEGWEKPVWELCEKIENLNKTLPESEQIKLLQVKEKFGELRFYTNTETGDVSNWIEEAGSECDRICENCGNPGEIRDDIGWMKTLCHRCHKKEL